MITPEIARNTRSSPVSARMTAPQVIPDTYQFAYASEATGSA